MFMKLGLVCKVVINNCKKRITKYYSCAKWRPIECYKLELLKMAMIMNEIQEDFSLVPLIFYKIIPSLELLNYK